MLQHFKKVLFVVHRQQLAKQTMVSYKKVFSDAVSMSLLTGKYSDYGADYVFTTIQTLSRDNHLFEYEANEFDCIILDDYEIIGLSQEAA